MKEVVVLCFSCLLLLESRSSQPCKHQATVQYNTVCTGNTWAVENVRFMFELLNYEEGTPYMRLYCLLSVLERGCRLRAAC